MGSHKSKSKRKGIYGWLVSILSLEILLFLTFAFLIFSRKILEIHNVFWGNLFITLISFLAFISFVLFIRNYKDKLTFDHKGNFFFASALCLFFLGDLLWFGTETILTNPLFSALPDVVWNLAYIAMMCSLFLFIIPMSKASRVWTILFIALGFIAGFANIIINVNTDFAFKLYNLNYFIQQLYPAYDFIILGLLLALLAPLVIHRNLAFIKIYFWLFGIISRILFDNLFADKITLGTYYTGHGIDLIYLLFYLSISISVVFRATSLEAKK